MLTRGAMPVLAGMRAVLQGPAIGALGDMTTKRLGPALCHGRHGGQRAGGPTGTDAGALLGAMALEHRGPLDQQRPPETLRGRP